MESSKLNGTLLIIAADISAAEMFWKAVSQEKQIKDDTWSTKYYTARITPIYFSFSTEITYKSADCIIYLPKGIDKDAFQKKVTAINEAVGHDTSLIYTDCQSDTEMLEFSTSSMIELIENDIKRLIEALDCSSWKGMLLINKKEQNSMAATSPKLNPEKAKECAKDEAIKDEYEYLEDEDDKNDKFQSLLMEMRKMKECSEGMPSDERIEKAAQLMSKLEELIGDEEL